MGLRPVKNDFLRSLLRLLPIPLCGIGLGIFFLCHKDASLTAILQYSPENLWLAAGFLLGLYALKSLVAFSPIMILHVAGGFLFPPLTAVGINLLGTVMSMLCPYSFGRRAGSDRAEKLGEKYPKIQEIMDVQQNRPVMLSMVLRILSFIPGDAVSMYLGAMKIPLGQYLLGSAIGVLPGVLTSSLLGGSISHPASPIFWVSIALMVALSAATAGVYFLWKRRKNGRTEHERMVTAL